MIKVVSVSNGQQMLPFLARFVGCLFCLCFISILNLNLNRNRNRVWNPKLKRTKCPSHSPFKFVMSRWNSILLLLLMFYYCFVCKLRETQLNKVLLRLTYLEIMLKGLYKMFYLLNLARLISPVNCSSVSEEEILQRSYTIKNYSNRKSRGLPSSSV